MADEAKDKDKDKNKEKATPVPAKGMSMKLILMVGTAALLIGLGGAIAFFKLSGDHKGGETSNVAQAETVTNGGHGETSARTQGGGQGSGAMYDLDSFIVNLADQPEARYLKVTLKLELDRQDASADVAARLPQVRDAVLILLSSKESSNLRTTQGKFQLRDEITQRVNNALPRSEVRTVYFTEFVVQ
jgi:flagellar FliL protein